MTRKLALVAVVLLPAAAAVGQEQGGVSTTVHNLSVSGPGEIKAQSETEVCKFCHIPHNTVAAEPLWGHALSQTDRYDVPTIRRGAATVEQPPQPSGSSRLCLSCHDGTVALGDVGRAGRILPMTGAQRLERGRRGHMGTDLSGSHPISVVVPESAAETQSDMGLKPLSLIRSEGQVRLDADGKIQCSTCHEPHSDRHHQPGRVPRFWVKPTVTEVCLACHHPR